MKYGKSIIALSGLALSLGIFSCKSDKNESERNAAVELYSLTCEVANSYIDSLSNAKDSIEVNRLFEAFDARIDEINMSVRPDTDYELSEDENDTIAQLLDRISEVRSERLKALRSSGLTPTVMDTIPEN